MIRSFRDMDVWNKALELSERVFVITLSLPKSEDYALTSQIRRSANSVTANIAEGFGRKSSQNKIYFYTISRGSAFETQSHLLFGSSEHVNYFHPDKTHEIIADYDNLIHQLNKIMKSIR